MTRTGVAPRFRWYLSHLGTPTVLLLLVANLGVLSAKEEHEKPKEKKAEHAAKAPKPENRGGEARGEAGHPGVQHPNQRPEGGRPMGGQDNARPAPTPRPEGVRPGSEATRPSPMPRPDQGRPPAGGQGQPFQPANGRPMGGGPGGIHPPERQVMRTPNGGEIHRDPGGAIREIHTPGGAIIRHNPNGVRVVEVARPGGGMIVANASGRYGYVQRPMMFHGQAFVQRTYVVNGMSYARVYRPWGYGGRMYNVYAPTYYYRPGFYAWAYRPWARPVYWGWGWNARPWYGYYGGYFAPYPYYASPCFWLTDFIIASTLETAYLAQNASYSAPPVTYDAQSGMSPDTKQAIADEVRRQMQQAQTDQAASQNGMPPAGPPPLFTPNGPRVFLVSANVLAYAGGQECPLSEGDVLGLVQTPAPGAEFADVRIMSSRRSSCPRGSVVSVRTLDLQEMQNAMQANIDQGMAKLQASQGSNGLPPVPQNALGTVNTPFAAEVSPDDQALADLDKAVKDANSSEQAMINQGGQPAPAPGNPGSGATITLGMTRGQVVGVLGQPVNTVDLGAKMIYIYSNLKVTFLNGRVSDVQ